MLSELLEKLGQSIAGEIGDLLTGLTSANRDAKKNCSTSTEAGSPVTACPLGKSTPSPESIATSVNPTNSTINCGNIVDAVIARLDGSNPNATAPGTQDGSFEDIGNRHNTVINFGNTFDGAFKAVKDGGDGTVAIVGIVYKGSGGAHVVTMANDGGTVGIIEGQNWGPGDPAEVITDPAAAKARYGADSDVGIGILPKPQM